MLNRYFSTIYRVEFRHVTVSFSHNGFNVTAKSKNPVPVAVPHLSLDVPLLMQDVKEIAQTLIGKGIRVLGSIAKSYAESILKAPHNAYVQC